MVNVMDKQSDLKPAIQDVYQQVASESESAEVTYVRTPEELQAALSTGARHIEIIDHLDLSSLEAASIDTVTSHPSKLGLSPSTWTIRVRPSHTWYAAGTSRCETTAVCQQQLSVLPPSKLA
jgi:hypothetical protein